MILKTLIPLAFVLGFVALLFFAFPVKEFSGMMFLGGMFGVAAK